MGGRLAIRTALSHPSLFSALVLVSTTAGIEDPAALDARRLSDAQLAAILESGDIAQFEREWQALPLWRGDPESVSNKSREMRSLNDPFGLAESLRGFGSGSIAPVWDRLGEIDLPTAVLAGDRDSGYCELAARLAAGIRDSSLTTVSGSGHSIPLEQPAAVAAAVEGISRRLRPEES
jgi:2-succinyl-6-hydroxy-2,4-cyclohexadiene-1-carboxylate synthase